MSRREGKTTRTIDAAIQVLFSKGEIYIPTQKEYILKHFWSQFLKGKDAIEEQVIVDPDIHSGPIVQEYLRERLIRRLYTEHPGEFTSTYENRRISLVINFEETKNIKKEKDGKRD